MKKYGILLAGILVSAFFIANPVLAVEDRQPQHVCAAETQEQVLIKGIKESPNLLLEKLEGDKLQFFFKNMEKAQMLIGSIGVDKIYIFYSENHPTWVYVYFLNDGCILDVKFTYKNLVEYFLTGDESLIRRPK